MKKVLERFGVSIGDLIGSGQESKVYLLGNKNILKVAKKKGSIENAIKLKEFYDRIDFTGIGVQTPKVSEVGEVDGFVYQVEKYIEGYTFHELMKTQPRIVNKAIKSLLMLPNSFPNALVEEYMQEDNLFGNIFDTKTGVFLQTKTWKEYLIEFPKQVISTISPSIYKKLIDPKKAIETFTTMVGKIDYQSTSFVHGDYWYPNVLFDAKGDIVGLFDVNLQQTISGDPMLDSVCASVTMRDAYTSEPFDLRTVAEDLFVELYPDQKLKYDVYKIYVAFAYLPYEEEDRTLVEYCSREINKLVRS